MSSSSDESLVVFVVLVIIAICFKYIAIAAGIGLVLFGLFHLFKWLYIGWTKESKADPLFTSAAKDAAKKHSFDIHAFQSRNAISDERMRYILIQLELAGVFSDNKVLVENQWKLHSVFRAINAEDDYFLSKVNEQVFRLQENLDKQIALETDDLSKSILSSLRNNIKSGLEVDYLSSKLNAIQTYASQGELDSLSEKISKETSVTESLNVSEDTATLSLFDSFTSILDSISSSRIWDAGHRALKIEQGSFLNIMINGEERMVPVIDLNDRRLYFYPSFVIIANYTGRICSSIHTLSYASNVVYTRSFTESRGRWFNSNDAKVSYTTWLHTRRDGAPDMRYSYNPSIAVYQFYEAKLSGLNLSIISGSHSVIDNIKTAFSFLQGVDTSSRSVSRSSFIFEFLGIHDWKDVPPSEIKLEDSSIFPDWAHTYVYSRTAVLDAERSIQEAYKAIRSAFLDGTYYDLSDPEKTNYGFVLFFDLFEAYSNGKSDIQKLCKELDILTISCGKTEKYLKKTFDSIFKRESIPQVDKDFAATYFCFSGTDENVVSTAGCVGNLFEKGIDTRGELEDSPVSHTKGDLEKRADDNLSNNPDNETHLPGRNTLSIEEYRELRQKKKVISNIIQSLSYVGEQSQAKKAQEIDSIVGEIRERNNNHPIQRDISKSISVTPNQRLQSKKEQHVQKQRMDVSLKNDLVNAVLACKMRRGESQCLNLVNTLHNMCNPMTVKTSKEYYRRLREAIRGLRYAKGNKEIAPVLDYILYCKMNDVSDVSLMALVGSKFPSMYRKIEG